MRQILRRRESVDDPWRYPGESAGEDEPRVLACRELRDHAEKWLAGIAPVGVHLAPGDGVEDIAGYLPRLALVTVEFPNFSDGRGFTHATLLRRHGFRGELRAVGAGVKQDLLLLMARCGFDSFDLAPGQDPESALRALDRYSVAYQPAKPLEGVGRVRYGS